MFFIRCIPINDSYANLVDRWCIDVGMNFATPTARTVLRQFLRICERTSIEQAKTSETLCFSKTQCLWLVIYFLQCTLHSPQRWWVGEAKEGFIQKRHHRHCLYKFCKIYPIPQYLKCIHTTCKLYKNK